MPASQLQRHANECLDRRMREAGHPELADPPRPGARAPPGPGPHATPGTPPRRMRSLSRSRSPSPESRPSSPDTPPRAPAERRPAPPPVPAEPLVVRPEEVDDLISAIHIRRFDADAETPGSETGTSRAASASAGFAVSGRSTEWKPAVSILQLPARTCLTRRGAVACAPRNGGHQSNATVGLPAPAPATSVGR